MLIFIYIKIFNILCVIYKYVYIIILIIEYSIYIVFIKKINYCISYYINNILIILNTRI